MKCVFIGGPWDGTTREVGKGQRSIEAVKVEPRAVDDQLHILGMTREVPATVTTYEHQQIRDGLNVCEYYVAHGEGSALPKLLEWYGQKSGKDKADGNEGA